jgi:opacity protein-like surface antigen
MKKYKKIKTGLIGAVLYGLLFSHNFCFADNGEIMPYLRIDSGWSKFTDIRSKNKDINSVKLKSNAANMISAGVGLGFDFGDNLRSDISFTRHLNPKLYSNSRDFKISRKPLIDAYFFNLYYETDLRLLMFKPYIGASIGLSNIKDKITYETTRENSIKRNSSIVKNKMNLAYRLMIGSAFEISPNVKLDLAYHYSDYGKSGSNIYINKVRYTAHSLSLGIRFGV